MAVKRKLIVTRTVDPDSPGIALYESWEPAPGDAANGGSHHYPVEINPESPGQLYGKIANRRLSPEIDKLAPGPKRAKRVYTWQEKQYTEALEAIYKEHPGLRDESSRVTEYLGSVHAQIIEEQGS